MSAAGARLLDVEGTTTPFEFVHEVLFPFARASLDAFFRAHLAAPEIESIVAELRAEHAAERAEPPPPFGDAVPYCLWLMDRDRKSTPLKSLQGRIWEEGYRSGALVAPVYPDVPVALGRWRGEGRTIAIYSSGSVLAQRLLFAHTDHGDLTPRLDGYFDTASGPKKESASYARIATALHRPASDVLFVSDVVAELDAAAKAGMATALAVRPGRPESDSAGHRVVRTFDEI